MQQLKAKSIKSFTVEMFAKFHKTAERVSVAYGQQWAEHEKIVYPVQTTNQLTTGKVNEMRFADLLAVADWCPGYVRSSERQSSRFVACQFRMQIGCVPKRIDIKITQNFLKMSDPKKKKKNGFTGLKMS